jgi:hypothetical protein
MWPPRARKAAQNAVSEILTPRRLRKVWQKLPGKDGFPAHDRFVTPLAAPR